MAKNISLLLLGLVSIALSRIAFLFANDPEGPNLLIVMVLAAIIFAVVWAAYALVHRTLRSGKVR